MKITAAKFSCITFMLCASTQLFCPSFIMHLVIAEKWLNTQPPLNEKELNAFILGTLFPDIRYIAHLSRDVTHAFKLYDRATPDYDAFVMERYKTIATASDAFEKGWLLHGFVDYEHGRFEDTCFFEHIKTASHRITYIKLLEDEMLYDEFVNSTIYQKALNALTTVDPHELHHGITPGMVARWHARITCYLKNRPSKAFGSRVCPDTWFTEKHDNLSSSAQDPQSIKEATAILEYFEHVFTLQKKCTNQIVHRDGKQEEL